MLNEKRCTQAIFDSAQFIHVTHFIHVHCTYIGYTPYTNEPRLWYLCIWYGTRFCLEFRISHFLGLDRIQHLILVFPYFSVCVCASRMLFILSLCHAISSSSTHSQTFHTHNFRISISINSLPIDVSPVCHHFTALQSNHFAHISILLFQKLMTICERQPALDPFALIRPFYFLFRSIHLFIWPFVFSVFTVFAQFLDWTWTMNLFIQLVRFITVIQSVDVLINQESSNYRIELRLCLICRSNYLATLKQGV